MNNGMKGIVLAGFAVAVGWMHNSRRKKAGLSWKAYGKICLGLGPQQAGRKPYLDELRFLAAVLVILVHAMQSGATQVMQLQQESAESMSPGIWYGLTGAAGLGLCCNLLFVMISGALLLPWREEKASSFYRKRFLKVLIPLAAYYLFYLRRSGLLSLSRDSVGNAIRMVISGPMELVPHFWLVYVLAGLYISVPFLRWMFRVLPDDALSGLAAVILTGLALKTGLLALGVGFGFDSFLFSWEGVFFLGYFWTRPCSGKYHNLVLAGGAGSAVLIVWLNSVQGNVALVTNESILMVLFSSAVFLLFQKRGKAADDKTCKKTGGRRAFLWDSLVRMIGRYSYSILLIHWFMLFVVVEKHLHIGPMMFGGRWIPAGILLQSVLALILSLIFAVVFDQTAVEVLSGLCGWGLRRLNSR